MDVVAMEWCVKAEQAEGRKRNVRGI